MVNSGLQGNGLLPVLYILAIFTHQVDAGNGHFLGGSVSYSTRIDTDGNIYADLYVMTGWVLQKGPCGAFCSKADVGVHTNTRRKNTLSTKGDLYYFGKWSAEIKVNSKITNQRNLTQIIQSQMDEVVLGVNDKYKVERDLMKVSVKLSAALPAEKETIRFEGGSWHSLTLQQPSDIDWRLDTKINKEVRNDTGQANRSPLVFLKPLYRIRLNEVNKIRIPVIDPDGDLVKCAKSEYFESGGISRNEIPGLSVSEDCVITIDATLPQYHKNAFGAVAVTVRDYNRNPLKFATKNYPSYMFSLGDVAAQFLVQVQDAIDGPVFVSPTLKANHRFILYAGAVWRQKVYAKAYTNRTIANFIAIGRQQETINVSSMKDGDEPRVKYVEIEWSPQGYTSESHVICISAIDDTGMDSNEDRCFTIQIKPDKFNHSLSPVSGRPYIIDLPAIDQLVQCEMDVTCVIPLYVVSNVAVASIRYTSSFFSDTNFGPIIIKQHDGRNVYESDLSFRDSVDGVKKICVIATDENKKDSDTSCIQSALQPLDPCASNPCKNSATCSRSKLDGAVYICHCLPKMSGRDCEIRGNACSPNPCDDAACFEIPPADFYCQCKFGFSGKTCSKGPPDQCLPDPCHGNGHCDAGKCSCYKRYNETNCSHDNCPKIPKGQPTCGVTGCSPSPCNAHGLCISGGICICSIGYRNDSRCNKASGNAVTLYHTSGTKFIPPSPPERSVLQCYLKKPCRFSVYIATSTSSAPTLKVDQSSLALKSSTVSTVTEANYIPGINKLYTAVVTVTGATTKGKMYLCLVADTGGSSNDRMCLEVAYTNDPSEDSGSAEYNHKNDTYRFIEPTPNGESQFICYANTECSLILHTNVVGATCERVISADDNVYVLDPQTGIDCTTEVFFNMSTEGEKRICFVASSSSKLSAQSRCFNIEIYTSQTDMCSSSPCQNGGVCFHKGRTDMRCACQAGYYGDHCEKGECSIHDNNCDTNAFCHVDNRKPRCICPVGMTGSKCNGRSTSAIPKSAFTDTAVPKTVTCVAKRICTIPLGVSTRASYRHSLEFGYVSPDIRTQGIVTERSLTDTTRATVSITPLEVGERLVCVQTLVNKANEDEVCVNVTVTADFSTVYGYQDRPHFIAPSLPVGASVRCPIEGSCHVLFHVTPGKGHEKECTSVHFTDQPFKYSHVFSTCSNCQVGQGSSNCSVDVSMIPPTSDISKEVQVCLAVELPASQLTGEKRCFTVLVQSKADFGKHSGCQKLTCNNGGFCDSHVHPPVCFCAPGFTGSTCDTPLPGGGQITPGNFITDFGIPSRLRCSLNASCDVNFHISGEPQNTPCVNIGYIDTDLAIERQPTVHTQPDGLGYTGTVVVRPKQVEDSKICVQTQTSGVVNDEMCVVIQVLGNPAPYIDQNKPYFFNPSIAGGTTVLCEAGQLCYIELFFPTGSTFNSTSECPNIELTSIVSSDGIHAFAPKANRNKCTVTVAFLSTSGDAGNSERLCIRVAVPGKPGEERCFTIETKVNIKNHVIGPCRGIACNTNASETCIANFNTKPTGVCSKGTDHGVGTSSCDGKTSQQVGNNDDEPEAPKSNVAILAGAGAGGAVAVAGVGVGVYILMKKAKKPKVLPDETDLPDKK